MSLHLNLACNVACRYQFNVFDHTNCTAISHCSSLKATCFQLLVVNCPFILSVQAENFSVWDTPVKIRTSNTQKHYFISRVAYT